MLNKSMTLSKTKPSGSKLEVLPATATHTVMHAGSPFILRLTPSGYGTVRYRRTSFNNHGHATRLADRLNAFFSTDAFTVLTT